MSRGSYYLDYLFDTSMDMESQAQLSVGWKYLSIPKLQRLHRCSLGMD